MVTTRTRIYSQSVEQETLADTRRRWSSYMRAQDYHALIVEVLQQELKKYSNSTVIFPSSLSRIMRECFLILASAPRIFSAAIDGTLTLQLPVHQALQVEYEQIRERAHSQPSIYIHLLADQLGLAPTATQYMVVRKFVLKYINKNDPADEETAFHIENVSHPHTSKSSIAQGYRKYLWTTKRSGRRVETMLKFCAGIEKRWLQTAPTERDIPFEHPPGECGYALNSHIRLEQHRKHISSNYVMNLVSDICAHLHNTGVFKQRFAMHPYIVYLIFRPSQVEIAEMFCSGLLQVYVENGGGFNYYPAGLSTSSKRRVSAAQWKEYEQYVRETSPLSDSMKRQREMMEINAQGLEDSMAKVVREALESGSEASDDDRDLNWAPSEVDVDELTQRLGNL